DGWGRRLGAGGNRFRRWMGYLGSVATDAALAAFFDHDLLGAAMRKTLAHGARLDAWLERQGLARDTQFLVAGSILVGHSVVLILWCADAPSILAIVVISNANPKFWPRFRQSCRRRPTGIGPEFGCATGMSCPPGQRAGQHVPHLTGPLPNPILTKLARR